MSRSFAPTPELLRLADALRQAGKKSTLRPPSPPKPADASVT
jgi:hypothetical protein